MPAVEQFATTIESLKLRLARSPLPGWWRAFGEAANPLLPPAWRRLFGGRSRRLCLERRDGQLHLSLAEAGSLQPLGELPADDAWLLAQLRERLLEAGTPAWLLLPVGAVLRRRLTLPAAAESRLRDVLAHELDRQTPFSADQVSFEGRVLSRDPAQQQVQVELLVLPRARLESELQALGPLAGLLAGVDVVEADGRRLGLDLLPAGRRDRRADPGRRLNAALAGIAAVALLATLLLTLHNRSLALESLRADVAAANTEARQARLARNQLQARVQAANFLAARQASRPTMLEVLDELSRRIPDDTTIDKMTLDQGKLVLVGQSRGAPALVGLLQASPLLARPALSGAVQADPRTGRDRFTLAVDVVGQLPEDADGAR